MKRKISSLALPEILSGVPSKMRVDPNLRRRVLKELYKKLARERALDSNFELTPKTRERVEGEFRRAFDAGLKTQHLRSEGLSALQQTKKSKLSWEERLAYVGGPQGMFDELSCLIEQRKTRVSVFNLKKLKKEYLLLLKKLKGDKSFLGVKGLKRYTLLRQAIGSLRTLSRNHYIFFQGTRVFDVDFATIRKQSSAKIESASIFDPKLRKWLNNFTVHSLKFREESWSSIDPIMKRILEKVNADNDYESDAIVPFRTTSR